MDLGEGLSGPKAKKSPESLEKVSRARVPKVRKKSRSEKYQKTNFRIFLTFRTFFETFLELLGPGPGRFFRDFLAFGTQKAGRRRGRRTLPQHPSPKKGQKNGALSLPLVS